MQVKKRNFLLIALFIGIGMSSLMTDIPFETEKADA